VDSGSQATVRNDNVVRLNEQQPKSGGDEKYAQEFDKSNCSPAANSFFGKLEANTGIIPDPFGIKDADETDDLGSDKIKNVHKQPYY